MMSLMSLPEVALAAPFELRRCFVGLRAAFALAVMQRAAAERRKARAEDHARIDMVRTLHDLVSRCAFCLVEHRLDELAAQARELRGVVGRLVALRLAVDPEIEALSGFLAELALLHQRGEHVVRLAIALRRQIELLADLVADVEADHV